MNDVEKEERRAAHTLDFIWQPIFEGVNGPTTLNLPGLLTHLNYELYLAPCDIPLTNFWNKDKASDIRMNYIKQLRSNDSEVDMLVKCLKQIGEDYGT